MSYRTFWLARDLDGALRIYDGEPSWAETIWLRSEQRTKWFRKLPPAWFPEVKPGTKQRWRLVPDERRRP